jgi:hypothetical protein
VSFAVITLCVASQHVFIVISLSTQSGNFWIHPRMILFTVWLFGHFTTPLMEVSGQLHAPAALAQGRSLWYPLDRRLGGPQGRSGHDDEEKNSHPLPGLGPPII